MLLTDEMNEVFIVDGENKEAVKQQIKQSHQKMVQYSNSEGEANGNLSPKVVCVNPSLTSSDENIHLEFVSLFGFSISKVTFILMSQNWQAFHFCQ